MRERVLKILAVAALGLGSLASGQARAWGERGHHVICKVATRLVKEEGLKNFLASRGDMMGHVCNIPDIYWRGLGAAAKSGDSTHYIDAEAVPIPLKDVPLSFSDLLAMKFAKPVDIPSEFGSLWWRAQQFFERAGVAGRRAAGSPLPSPENAQNASDPYNSAVNDLTVNMGLMGHFVGDASQPYHNTSDYDGWGKGHGGIHSYFESDVVNALPLSLDEEVYLKALKIYGPRSNARKGAKKKGSDDDSFGQTSRGSEWVVARMKALSLKAQSEIPKLERLDKVLAPSKIEKDDEGKSIKTAAKRSAAELAAKRFKPLIESELASSAALLAEFWDTVYVESGRPELSAYKSYEYPLEPGFVAPDYVPAAKPSTQPL
jgi:hypothetical protein